MAFSANAMREGSTVTSRAANFSLQTSNGLTIAVSDSDNPASGHRSSASVSKMINLSNGEFDFRATTWLNPDGNGSAVGGSYRNGSNQFEILGITNNPVIGPSFSGVSTHWNLDTEIWGLRTLCSNGFTLDTSGALVFENEAWVSPSTTLPNTWWKALPFKMGVTTHVGNEEVILEFILLIGN